MRESGGQGTILRIWCYALLSQSPPQPNPTQDWVKWKGKYLVSSGLGWGGLWLDSVWHHILRIVPWPPPSRTAARPRDSAKLFQRKILSTVANTQPEWADTITYGCNCNCQFKEGIHTYIIQFVQYWGELWRIQRYSITKWPWTWRVVVNEDVQ